MNITFTKMLRMIAISTLISSMSVSGCHSSAQLRNNASPSYVKMIGQWREKRVARLKGDMGWLKLAGLFWLKPGINRMGSDASADIALPPRAPASLATLTMKGQDIYLSVCEGVDARFRTRPVSDMLLLSDQEGKREPDIITSGDLTFFVIDRGGKKALRLFDEQSQTMKSFGGLSYFPIDEKWKIDATFVPFASPRMVDVSTAIGTTVQEQVRGEVRFTVGSQSYSLQPVSEQGSKELFFVFADQTNSTETYGGGRFLSATLGPGGKVVLDFNKAYNPPCAFTHFATCPLPRAKNRLALEVRAGEKNYEKHEQENTLEKW